MSKFGLILDFDTLRFRNKSTWAYPTPNTNWESVDDDEGCMSSQNSV